MQYPIIHEIIQPMERIDATVAIDSPVNIKAEAITSGGNGNTGERMLLINRPITP